MKVTRRGIRARVFAWAVATGCLLAMCLNTAVSKESPKAQEDNTWTAPADARATKNPVPVTPEGLKEAGKLFHQVCSSCHGAKGAGDGPLANAQTRKPANFTDARRMRPETDGALFWKMSEGRGDMPSWEQLPEKLRWELVNYLRTLAPKGNSPGMGSSATK
jgi:mono/diheme cytochrome c family protein